MADVTPADRETAAKLVVMAELRELIRAGSLDDGPMVQTVAAHAEQARLEGIRLGLKAARKAISEDAQRCDCFAYDDDECACGARDGFKRISSSDALGMIEAIDPTTIAKQG